MNVRNIATALVASVLPVALVGASVFLMMRIYDWYQLTYTPISVSRLIVYGIAIPVSYALVSLVGAIVLAYQPRHRVGWLIWLIGVSWQLWDFAGSYQVYNQVFRTPGPPRPTLPGAWTAWALGPILWLPGAVLVVTLLPLLFPTGRALSARWQWAGWLALAGIGLTFVPMSYHDWTRRYYYPTAHKVLKVTRPEWVDQAYRIGLILIVIAALTSMVSLVVRFRRSHGVERQQLKWFLFGAAGAGLPAVFFMRSVDQLYYRTSLVQTWSSILSQLALALGLLCLTMTIGVAIVRHHLFDIDLIVNRAIVYAVLTACVIALYVLVVGALGVALDDRSNLFNSLAATGLIAVIFQPIRERLQRGVNRLMYGERDEPYAVLSRLGQRLEGSLTSDAVLPTIAVTVRDALKLPYAAIALKDGNTLVTAAAVGVPSVHLIHLPLVYQQEAIGELVLAPRQAGETFGPRDERLLSDLARQIGVAAHNVRLTEQTLRLNVDLQRSREQLVTAREEERRRLRRDLHDGLGPAMASMALQTEAARDLVVQDPQEATLILSGLTEQLQSATSEIRRLVYALRPPALDDLGLVGALRSYVSRYQRSALQVTIEVSEELPPLPAAVEVAAYRIVTEAVTNVIRHAQASTCSVRLVVDTNLVLEVVDDGIGLPETYQAGIGLGSMRERAAELGGTLVIERGEPSGTHVVAHLPLSSVDETEPAPVDDREP